MCVDQVIVLGTEARHHPHTLSINPEEKVQEVVLAGRGSGSMFALLLALCYRDCVLDPCHKRLILH